MNEFLKDVWEGLSSPNKSLNSKYFYDEEGDRIFREIMDCPEYYLTNCELDIFVNQSKNIAQAINGNLTDFDLVELGPGDCTKSKYLLKELLVTNKDFTYYPIDISENIINQINTSLPNRVPGIKIHGLNGDYMAMLEKLNQLSTKNKVVLFLGSSIGNIPLAENTAFFRQIRQYLKLDDLLIAGFDLKKDSSIILAAYNDEAGITKRFNINLLKRINNTLGANFDLDQFDHCPIYDLGSGACKSYLSSKIEQSVQIGSMGSIHFAKDELIDMEISQKYTVEDTFNIANQSGFTPIGEFYDSKGWFLDAMWQNNE